MDNILKKENNDLLVESKRGKIDMGMILTALIFLLAGLTGLIPQSIQSVGILGVAALMLFTGEVYLIYPIMLFYGNSLGILAGVSVYRWFTLLFLMITVITVKSIRMQTKQLLVFLLFILYCLVVVAPDNIRRALFVILDMLCILLLINCYLRKEVGIKRFFTVYVLTAFIAYFTGTQREGLELMQSVDGKYVEMIRNMATFEDPNYMGYFYTGAVFAAVGFKLFHPVLRVLVVVALYAILITSLSVTAIVANVLLWIVYLLLTKSIKFKVLPVIAVAIVLVFGLYQYGLEHPETEVIGSFAQRIEEKLEQAESGDISQATSGRSELAKKHLDYFWSQPIHRMLVGMNAASTLKIDLGGYKMAAHNEYVDWLLNVGILGFALMLYYLITTIWISLRRCWRDKNDRKSVGVMMVKLVWVMYAFTLTLYGDYRFMLFFLL